MSWLSFFVLIECLIIQMVFTIGGCICHFSKEQSLDAMFELELEAMKAEPSTGFVVSSIS